MKIVVPKESRDGERRVALTPDSAKKFIALGCSVTVEAGRRRWRALFPTTTICAAGAEVADDLQLPRWVTPTPSCASAGRKVQAMSRVAMKRRR